MSTQADVITMREEAAQSGEQIYEQRLRSLLEPSHNGRVVAIHIPSKPHFVGDSVLEASDLLRATYPRAARGEVYARGIGERVIIRARTPRIVGSP